MLKKRSRGLSNLFLLLFLFSLSIDVVLGADWQLMPLRNDFSNSFSDLCFYDDQCLVNHKGNPLLNDPSGWYSAKKDKDEPRCIDNYEYVLDYYCDRGDWTSRTRLVGLELFGAAYSPGRTQFNKNFTMVCGQYNFVLNTLNYNNQFVNVKTFLDRSLNTQLVSNKKWHPILNNVCIIDFDKHIVLGVSLNSNISSADSFLKALDFDAGACDSQVGVPVPGYSTEYLGCTGSGVKSVTKSNKTYYELYYDKNTNTLIYDPDMVLLPYPINALLQLYPNVIEPQFVAPLTNYVRNNAHNSSAGRDFGLFYNPKLYNNIYLSMKDNTSIFAFIEEDQTSNHTDYLGFVSKNINFPPVICDIIVNSDGDAVTYCQNNVAPNYMVVSKKPNFKTPKLMELWKGLTSLIKIR